MSRNKNIWCLIAIIAIWLLIVVVLGSMLLFNMKKIEIDKLKTIQNITKQEAERQSAIDSEKIELLEKKIIELENK